MAISNNFLEKKLYIITISEKEIFDLTLVALEVLQKTECVLISKKFDKKLIKNLEKIKEGHLVVYYIEMYIMF